MPTPVGARTTASSSRCKAAESWKVTEKLFERARGVLPAAPAVITCFAGQDHTGPTHAESEIAGAGGGRRGGGGRAPGGRARRRGGGGRAGRRPGAGARGT